MVLNYSRNNQKLLDENEEFDTLNPSDKTLQVSDTISIVEYGINAGILNCSTDQLDKINYDRLETAIHYTGELAHFLQALEATTLPFGTYYGNRNNITPVNQLVSSMQDLSSTLLRPDCVNSELLRKDEKGVYGGSTFIDLEVECWYNWISSEEDDIGEEEQEDTTCVLTKWTTQNVNTAYEQLLR
ncbi:hypothetical protein L873DRAFT_1841328 [Choiromyces venosus 120613-1]|uniref:Uncharacterized protein n=1 Tax=Choiromyces venosus 120613-1 TaxID=1336337 RepID=A0A3N4K1X0_9PEZI|nr:hypothetical protein L873DRAFT_1841328 [Choiromyces venosus 120613-1]